MRIKNSIKNISISIISQIILTILGFISRKVFLDSLGIQYLGVNGVLTNILSLLGLLEAGIGSSIVYNLYKLLANNDKKKITALIQLYKKAYTILAILVFLLSLSLYPFLINIMGGTEAISNLTIVYSIFVCKNVLAYLYAHKWCIINADQKGYVLAKRNLIFSIITTIIKTISLVITKNYILYLFIEATILIIQNILNGRIVDKRYPYINEARKYIIDIKIKKNINNNVRALFLHNIGNYLVFGTDNLLISKFINVASVGIFSNYTMIITQLLSIISPIVTGIGSSVGNLIAVENDEKNYSIFKVVYLINFWIYSFCIIFLYNLLNPFINLWLGNEYLLDSFTVVIILVNCYLNGLKQSIIMFKTKAGIFTQDKYIPLITGIINLITSIILVKYFGLAGIFLGTTISTLSISFWNTPRLVYKYVFKKSFFSYLKTYSTYAILTILTCFLTTNVCDLFVIGNSLINLIIKGILCLIIPNTIYMILFFKTEEFQYIFNIIKIMLPTKLKIKLNFNK